MLGVDPGALLTARDAGNQLAWLPVVPSCVPANLHGRHQVGFGTLVYLLATLLRQ